MLKKIICFITGILVAISFPALAEEKISNYDANSNQKIFLKDSSFNNNKILRKNKGNVFFKGEKILKHINMTEIKSDLSNILFSISPPDFVSLIENDVDQWKYIEVDGDRDWNEIMMSIAIQYNLNITIDSNNYIITIDNVKNLRKKILSPITKEVDFKQSLNKTEWQVREGEWVDEILHRWAKEFSALSDNSHDWKIICKFKKSDNYQTIAGAVFKGTFEEAIVDLITIFNDHLIKTKGFKLGINISKYNQVVTILPESERQ